MLDVILAVSAGFRYDVQLTIWPNRIPLVASASAAIVVQHSKTASCDGSGMLWKWSYTQTESKPSSSAVSAISRHLAHWASPPLIERNSVFHPWGANTPNPISAMDAPYPDARF